MTFKTIHTTYGLAVMAQAQPSLRLPIIRLRLLISLLSWGVIPALMAVILAAVGKELWDAQGHGTPDRIDALATVAGGCAMLGWLLLIAPLITEMF